MRKHAIVIPPMNNCKFVNNGQSFDVTIRDDVDESVMAEILTWHEYRSADSVIRSAPHPIIDLGAHAGFFTLYCRTLNQTVPIIAIEPAPSNLKALHAHLSANKIIGVTVVKAAVGSVTRRGTLMLTSDSHNHYLSDKKRNKTEQEIPVQIFSLSDLRRTYNLNHVSLLKMDIEGGEKAIFTSLETDTLTGIEAIILEYHDTEEKLSRRIEQILREHGFSVATHPSRFDRTFGFLFARNKRLLS